MKQLICNIAVAIVAMAITSCNSICYTPYTFEQLRAADYTLPSDVQKVVIISCSKPIVEDSTYNTTDTAYINARLRYAQHMPALICSVLSDKINKSGYLTSEIDARFNTLGEIIANSDSICKKHNADAMLVINKNIYSSFVELTRYDDLIMVSAMQTDLQFVTKQGIVKQFETQHDTLTWVLTEDNTSFPAYRELYYSISEQVGTHIAMQLLPSWEKRKRVVVGTSSRQMADANNWVEADEWDKAKDIWADVTQNGNELNKVCATLNIGLYYERMDNVLESAMWFSKALDLIEQNANNKNIQSLKHTANMLFQRSIDRQHEKLLLDKQINN